MPDEWWGVFAVWKGGLGVWGGSRPVSLAGAIVAKRARANVPLLADAVAPGILLAQVIGRLGNYFNQELFGKPTTLPWGLEIDPRTARPAYARRPRPSIRPSSTRSSGTPLGVASALLALGRRLKPGGVFFLYVMWYSLGRLLLGGAAPDRPVARGFRDAPQLLDRARRLPRRASPASSGRQRGPPSRSRGRRPRRRLASAARERLRAVRDLELDLEAFEGPFDLLLTLVLKEELALSDVEIAESWSPSSSGSRSGTRPSSRSAASSSSSSPRCSS